MLAIADAPKQDAPKQDAPDPDAEKSDPPSEEERVPTPKPIKRVPKNAKTECPKQERPESFQIDVEEAK